MTLAERCDTSRNITGYHTPHEAGKFSGNCGFCYIGIPIVIKNHLVVLSTHTLIGFVGICDDFRWIPDLPGLESFGFESDLSPTIALCGFNQQGTDVAVTSLGNTKTILISATRILTGGESDVGSKMLRRRKTLEVADFCKDCQCGYCFNADETGQLLHILLIGFS